MNILQNPPPSRSKNVPIEGFEVVERVFFILSK